MKQQIDCWLVTLTAGQGSYLAVFLWGELLRGVAAHTEDRQEEDGQRGLPDLHHPGRDEPQDDQQPHEGQHGEEDRDEKERIFLDLPGLPGGNDTDTDGRDHEDVEGSGPDDQVRPELVVLKAVPDNSNDGEEYFRSRSRAWTQTDLMTPHS